jgi:hypothetical protein
MLQLPPTNVLEECPMQKPPLDPEVADFAPTDVTLTVYDEEYVVTYLLCLMPMRRVPTGERFRGSYCILRLSGGELDRARARVGAGTIAKTCYQAGRSAVVEHRN